MPISPLVLTLDQGGHASRALAFDSRGRLHASAERRLRTYRRGAAIVEHSPIAAVASLRQAAVAALRELGPLAPHVQTAALATQRSTIVCWDRATGRALSPVISWQDRRAARQVAALANRASALHAVTGLVLSPHYGASKIAWCLRHLPAVRKAARDGRLAAGPLAAFLLANLLVERPCVTDAVNASRTLLLDVKRSRWSKPQCRLFAVPEEILPACVPNRFAFGHLVIEGHRIPLQIVTGDQPAALFALGTPQRDCVYVNIGTGAFVQRLSASRRPGLLQSLVWQSSDERLFASEGTVNGAASALNTVGASLDIPERQMLRRLPQWLATDTEPPLFLNGIGGLGAPFWRPDFESRFIGNGSPPSKMVAVLESIAFLLTVNLQRMGGSRPVARRIVISGGLAQLDGLCQRLADLSGMPVLRPALHEATARGLAYLSLQPTHWPQPQVQAFIPEGNHALQRRYRRWRQAMQRTQ